MGLDDFGGGFGFGGSDWFSGLGGGFNRGGASSLASGASASGPGGRTALLGFVLFDDLSFNPGGGSSSRFGVASVLIDGENLT